MKDKPVIQHSNAEHVDMDHISIVVRDGVKPIANALVQVSLYSTVRTGKTDKNGNVVFAHSQPVNGSTAAIHATDKVAAKTSGDIAHNAIRVLNNWPVKTASAGAIYFTVKDNFTQNPVVGMEMSARVLPSGDPNVQSTQEDGTISFDYLIPHDGSIDVEVSFINPNNLSSTTYIFTLSKSETGQHSYNQIQFV